MRSTSVFLVGKRISNGEVTSAKSVYQPEALLQRVKRQAAELGRYKVRPVLHDLLEANVLVRALPGWHEV